MVNGEQFAKAWQDFLVSEDGKRCTDPTTLQAPESERAYLENRLWHAFYAGVEAAEIICGRK